MWLFCTTKVKNFFCRQWEDQKALLHTWNRDQRGILHYTSSVTQLGHTRFMGWRSPKLSNMQLLWWKWYWRKINLAIRYRNVFKEKDVTGKDRSLETRWEFKGEILGCYGCESWTIKKTECWRIDAFELWCWRRLLRVPWTARRSNQSILRRSVLDVHWKDWCWSWNSNTLATWCEELTHLRRPWCWERLRAGEEGDDRGWDGWMASPTQWVWVWVDSGSWWWTGRTRVLQFMGSQRVGHDGVTELNWTATKAMKVGMKGGNRFCRVCKKKKKKG